MRRAISILAIVTFAMISFGASIKIAVASDGSPSRFMQGLGRIKVDDQAAAAAGIRRLDGKRITLYTDLPSSPEIDQLPAIFDLAFPQWCAYFGIDPNTQADWRMTGFLMKNGQTFRRLGLLPGNLPPFKHGFSRNYELWLYEQPTDYYRRHLFLHEGTHGFMNTVLGGCGPPWYMEGTAELLGTHLWKDGQLKLAWNPPTRDDAKDWGRVKLVKDAVAQGRVLGVNDVMNYSTTAHRETEPYAWCWALSLLMDRDPRFEKIFRAAGRNVRASDFTNRFRQAIGADWPKLDLQWRLMIDDLQYGYDVRQNSVDLEKTTESPLSSGNIVSVEAERGWQNSGISLTAGKTYRIRAAGRYQVADSPQIWWCEPAGVTFRYHDGRPLGMLQAAVVPQSGADSASQAAAMAAPIAIGLDRTIRPERSGTLMLKINDSPGELQDNAGSLKVHIMPIAE